MFRRRQLGSIALALAFATAAQGAAAQAWPSKPIRIVSPYAAGGVGDTIFRLIAPALEQRLGQRFVIDNKTGAGGNIGTSEVVRAAPDGYTLLMAPTANYSVNQYLFKLNFDPIAQLEPVVAVAEAPLIAVVSPAVTATSLKQLSEQVRAGGNKFNFGSPGAGSPTHLAGASFSLMHGNAMEHIGFRGTPPMVQAMLASDVQLAFPTLTPVAGQLKAGKLHALAVLARQRLPELPNVPTAAEAGFPDLVFGNWWVLAAPKGTDPAIVNRLASEIRQQLADPAIKARLAELGHVPLAYGPAETAAFVRAESTKYRTLIERTGIRLD
ncbi:MAG TPA: tripartite tricarboxylate transporter substrate binding protein [Ramlibacter sp.]|nr:tripartite tricarboxylate transporter substrate binding protein [Ramlibacter sp.]